MFKITILNEEIKDNVGSSKNILGSQKFYFSKIIGRTTHKPFQKKN